MEGFPLDNATGIDFGAFQGVEGSTTQTVAAGGATMVATGFADFSSFSLDDLPAIDVDVPEHLMGIEIPPLPEELRGMEGEGGGWEGMEGGGGGWEGMEGGPLAPMVEAKELSGQTAHVIASIDRTFLFEPPPLPLEQEEEGGDLGPSLHHTAIPDPSIADCPSLPSNDAGPTGGSSLALAGQRHEHPAALNSLAASSSHTGMPQGSEFSAFQGESSGGDFGAFQGGSSGGDFGAFQGDPLGGEPGGDFGTFQGAVSSGGEFGTFQTGSIPVQWSDGKGEGGAAMEEEEGEEGGGFSDFKSATWEGATASDKPAAAGASDSAAGNDDDDDEFGDFSSGQPVGGSSHTTTPAPPAHTQQGLLPLPSASQVLPLCFCSPVDPTGAPDEVSKMEDELEARASVWKELCKCVDFTVPLYKWENAHLQQAYYTALSVTPMILGPSAMEDLIGSFGFESGLVQPSLSPVPMFGDYPEATSPVAEDHSAPSLLDLSLLQNTLTPSDEKDEQSSALALVEDLQGLDLHHHLMLPSSSSSSTTSGTGHMTSRQELQVNEQLLVRSTWMDSRLAEFGTSGVHKSHAPPPTSSSSSSTPGPGTPSSNRHAGAAVVTMEEQLAALGLDSSKTTFLPKPSHATELSLSAKLVLGRLPNLSFMTSHSLVLEPGLEKLESDQHPS